MAQMLRPKGKAKKIAYALLGVPANIAAKRNKRQQYINERLLYDETRRVR